MTNTGRNSPSPPTFGIEEEFLLLRTDTGRPAARAPRVLRSVPAAASTLTEEITRFQLESNTPICHTAEQAHHHLSTARRTLLDAAARHGLRLAATGCAPHGTPATTPVTDEPRYRDIGYRFGRLLDSHTVCGCHVHIGMPDLPTTLQVSNHLRPYLPTLLALSANSPFCQGHDTGHASWRSIVWASLPSAGPPPFFRDPEDYHRAVSELLSSGAALDRGMIYWAIRPAPHLSTLEVRIADVAGTADESLLIALLIRGLATSALVNIAKGRPAVELPDSPLRLALWRAAHDGLEGDGLDTDTGGLTPSRALLDRLFKAALVGLDICGDTTTVTALIDRQLRHGSGAHRQRAAHSQRGRLDDVVALLTEQTGEALPA